MPALSEMGLAVDATSCAVSRERYSRVSLIVLVGRCESASTSASIAATGIVSSVSDESRLRYVLTMSNGGELSLSVCETVIEGGSTAMVCAVWKGRLRMARRWVRMKDAVLGGIEELL